READDANANGPPDCEGGGVAGEHTVVQVTAAVAVDGDAARHAEGGRAEVVRVAGVERAGAGVADGEVVAHGEAGGVASDRPVIHEAVVAQGEVVGDVHRRTVEVVHETEVAQGEVVTHAEGGRAEVVHGVEIPAQEAVAHVHAAVVVHGGPGADVEVARHVQGAVALHE